MNKKELENFILDIINKEDDYKSKQLMFWGVTLLIGTIFGYLMCYFD